MVVSSLGIDDENGAKEAKEITAIRVLEGWLMDSFRKIAKSTWSNTELAMFPYISSTSYGAASTHN